MHCHFRQVGRYESTGGWCWAVAKMRTADTMVCEVCGENLVRESSHFLQGLIFCGSAGREGHSTYLCTQEK